MNRACLQNDNRSQYHQKDCRQIFAVENDDHTDFHENSQEKELRKHLASHCRSLFAFLLSTIGISILLMGYIMLGGLIFQAIECKHELHLKNKANLVKSNLVDKLISKCERANFEAMESALIDKFNDTEKLTDASKLKIHQLINEFSKRLFELRDEGWSGFDENNNNVKWSLAGSILYSVTVITTIGYGHVAPKTHMGKLMTIIYAILGMPLFLLYLNNIGDYLARMFRVFYVNILQPFWRFLHATCFSRNYRKRKERQKRCVGHIAMTVADAEMWFASLRAVKNKTPFKGARIKSGSRFGPLSRRIFVNSNSLDAIIDENNQSSGIAQKRMFHQSPSLAGFEEIWAKAAAANTMTETEENTAMKKTVSVFDTKFFDLEDQSEINQNSGKVGKNTKLTDRQMNKSLFKHRFLHKFKTKKILKYRKKSSSIPLNISAPVAANLMKNFAIIDKKLFHLEQHPSPTDHTKNQMNRISCRQSSNQILKHNSQSSYPPIRRSYHRSQSQQSAALHKTSRPKPITIPLSLSLAVMVIYTQIGAVLFNAWETQADKYDYFTWSYFTFITLSTIGFGDIVPGTKIDSKHSGQKLIIVSFYVAFGLSVFAMSVKLMQEEVVAKIKRVGELFGIIKPIKQNQNSRSNE